MTTKAAFVTAMGGAKRVFGQKKVFTRTAADVLTSVAHGLETGAGPFKVMTAAADAPAGLVAAVRASTFMTGTTMIATDVLNVNLKAYTLIATPAADGDVDLGADDTVTLANITAAINQTRDAAAATYDLDTAPNPDVFAEVTTAARIDIFAKTLDAAIANAIAVSSPDGTMVVDNATLQGGVDGTDYYVIRLTDDTLSLATSKALAQAGTVVAITDAGTGVHKLVPTVDTLAEAMEDVLTNYLTHTGTKSLPAAHNIARFWAAVIDGSSDALV